MRRPDRHHATRVPIVLLAFSAVILAGALPEWSRGAEPRRPNFVFVYCDDQRWDAMSVVQREQGERARFPWLKTPNMDRLAAEGVRFRNAFVVNSLCAPSRASYLTGRYGHENGIVNNHTPFPLENVTYARLLQQTGYRTGYVGKWHMDGQKGQRPGFDYSASFIGQGRYVDCPFEINGNPTATKGWVDDVSTDFAMQFIRDHKDEPFLLAVGFKSAHGPFDPPERLAGVYDGETARPVPNLDHPAIYLRGGGAGAAQKSAAKKKAGGGGPGLGYFRCLTAADENLGRLLKLLDELSLSNDTMVVFSSDNGFYLGEHRLGDKRSAYDESLRIPLLVRYPRLSRRGGTIDAMALNIDLAPTFLDFAGVAIPKEVQGRSWRPLLEGRGGDWRKAYFYCYFYERGYNTPTVTAVRTDTAKLIRYPGHEEWTELFDLAADPYELKNLIDDPAQAALRKRMEAEYERQSSKISFQTPPFADTPGEAAKANQP
jgi:arylsulfatase A-like enzyme